MQGYVHSLQSLGTVDGPGVRSVVFGEGCPLRCVYCHNPDTWDPDPRHLVESSTLAGQILRFYPYIKNGGVTFSGGEPCLQAEFFAALAEELKSRGLHIALDTCGEVWDPSVERLLSLVDLVLLDVKFTLPEEHHRHTGGELSRTLGFLDRLEGLRKPTWIRHVVVPGLNDSEEDVLRLANLLREKRCVQRVELLPFRSLCLEKYRSLGLIFPLEGTPQMDPRRLADLQTLLEASI